MSYKKLSMADILVMEAEFVDDFSSEARNKELYNQMHPQGHLLAEGHDNYGSLPPLDAGELSKEMVHRDTQFGIFSVA